MHSSYATHTVPHEEHAKRMSLTWRVITANWNRDDGPMWRMVPWLLLAALILRLFLAISSDYIWRIDESQYYLEQAHRAVFGYGFIPAAYQTGIRTWLIAGLPISVLQLFSWVGLDHPDYYVPAIRSINAGLSLALPVGTYVLCRRVLNEKTARAAFIISCFWYELIVMAPHTLAEFYSTALFFLAASLLTREPSKARAATVGMLLGFALAFRVHYAFAIAPFGLLLFFLYRTTPVRATYVIGGLAALLVWGFIDRLTWGGWWSSLLTYYANAQHAIATKAPNPAPILGKLLVLFVPSLGIVFLAIAWGIYRIKHLWIVVLPIIGVIVFHLTAEHKAIYANFHLLIALCTICVGDMSQFVRPGMAKLTVAKQRIRIAILAFTSALGLVGILPGMIYTQVNRNDYYFASSPQIGALRFISRIPPADVKLIVYDRWFGGPPPDGYYFVHHRVPYVLPGSNYHSVLSEHSYGKFVAKYASHIISDVPNCYPSFEEISRSGSLSILEKRALATGSDPKALPFNEQDLALVYENGTFPAAKAAYFLWREECLQGIAK